MRTPALSRSCTAVDGGDSPEQPINTQTLIADIRLRRITSSPDRVHTADGNVGETAQARQPPRVDHLDPDPHIINDPSKGCCFGLPYG